MSVSGRSRDHPTRLGHLPALDGLRAVAVVMVMAYHAGIAGFSGAKAGVDVFFVLSGFLITALLLEERSRTGTVGLGAFYMRRVLRLYPALLVAIIGAITLAAVRMPVFAASSSALRSTIRGTPFALLYTMNVHRALGSSGGYLGHAWSLAIEEQFYLAWPAVVLLSSRRSHGVAIVGAVAVACAVSSAVLRAGLDVAGVDSELLYNATFSHVDGIFAGCAFAALWFARPAMVARVARPAVSLVAVASIAAVVVHGRNMNIYGYAVVAVATLVLLADALARVDSRLSAVLSMRPLVAVGRRSYGLYLYHWPIFLFIGIDTRLPILALGFGASFAAAWISYAVIEQRFLRLKDRWRGTAGRSDLQRAGPTPQASTSS